MQDPAFQSQQFAQDSNRRKESYIHDQGQAIGQGLPAALGQFQQGQRHVMDQAMGASQLASQEVARQTAMQELAWARELHTTDMMAMQKDLMRAQTDYQIAKFKRDTEGLGETEVDPFMPEWARDRLLAQGFETTFRNGKAIVIRSKDPEIARQAQERIETNRRNLAFASRHELDAWLAGEVWDSKTGQWRPGTQEELDAVERRMTTQGSTRGTVEAAKISAKARVETAREAADARERSEQAKRLQEHSKQLGAEIEKLQKMKSHADDEDVPKIQKEIDRLQRMKIQEDNLIMAAHRADEPAETEAEHAARIKQYTDALLQSAQQMTVQDRK